jgi:hypothetical protein
MRDFNVIYVIFTKHIRSSQVQAAAGDVGDTCGGEGMGLVQIE